jgi:outer membrane receptor protein involved in Fe transport
MADPGGYVSRKVSVGGVRFERACLGFLLLLAVPAGPAGAGTTGRLAGTVLDRQKQPLAGVNVSIPAARTGAITDAEGRYSVLNLPPGQYQVKIAILGYQPVTVEAVSISADHTTRLDRALVEAPLPMAEVVVTAKRPVVDLEQTSSMAVVQREEIAQLPVQELQDIVSLQAGVVGTGSDLHFRGGRVGEVQYQVDGVSVNNSYDNKSALRIDRSLLEEVQVISGTFDAEYGQAMSGVVNAVLRRGSDKFRWDAEIYRGAYLYSDERRDVNYDSYDWNPVFDPNDSQNYQLGASGPTGLPKTYFIANLRRGVTLGYLRSEFRFAPTDSNDYQNKIFKPSGDLSHRALGTSREWSGLAKLDNRSIPDVNVAYQGILNQIESRAEDWKFRFMPDGRKWQRTVSIVHGPDWTHTLTPSSYYSVSFRQNYFDYRDLAYEDMFDGNYDAAGPLQDDAIYERESAWLEGVDLDRLQQTTDTRVLKATFVGQVARHHQIKVGGEVLSSRLKFGAPGYVLAAGVDSLLRVESAPPFLPGYQTYYPLSGAAYVQDEVEWDDLRLRAGLRFEYFDARSVIPSDLANPANSIPGAPPSTLVPTTRKVSLAPRIGVSYPIGNRASAFFAYSHSYQMPPLKDAFGNADYGVLADLQSGVSDYDVVGNPDIRPERTVQYQFGYRHILTEWLGLDVNAFYKDIRDLIGTEFIYTYNDGQYSRLANVDFGNVLGFTVAMDQRPRGLIGTSIDYTWQLAHGNTSDPYETANLAENDQDPRPAKVPLNWDQRHTLNVTVSVARPGNFATNAVLRLSTGQPYTPELTAFGSSIERNSGRKPFTALLDLRGEKTFKWAGMDAAVFLRVFNALDTRFYNGFVFASSGSPDYSKSPERDVVQLANPTRYFGPRRIELGFSLRAGG